MQKPDDIRTETDYLWSEGKRKAEFHHRIIVDYFRDKLHGDILDIGEDNPLKQRIQERYQVKIDSTSRYCDFDDDLFTDNLVKRKIEQKYDIVIMSHVLEHLFNPLFCLINIKNRLKEKGLIYIITTIKPYWISPARCHFHEMDHNRFKALIERAGLRIVLWEEYSVPIPFRFSIRNCLRRLYKEYSIVKLCNVKDV